MEGREARTPVTHDLYIWKTPADIDVDEAARLVADWQALGGDPAASPFEPSSDVAWFYRELMLDEPRLDAVSDAPPNPSRTPVWLATNEESPARVVAIRLPADPSRDALDDVFALATKYDLVLYDARHARLHHPLEELAAYASATFWPSGAIQAGVAGGAGLLVAVLAWLLAIPVLSWIAVLVGGFMFVMAIYTFVHEGRKAFLSRRGRGAPPPAA
jgi:hypothetical protein